MISHPPDDQNHDPKNGRFLPRNTASRGRESPYARDSIRKKQAIIKACTVERLEQVMAALFKAAVAGDVAAAKVFLDRAVGKVADDPFMLDRLAKIEQALGIQSDPAFSLDAEAEDE